MPNNFVVFCIPRTGSYHLTSLLDSCPDVVCLGELFKPGRLELPEAYKGRIDISRPKARDARPDAYIKQVRDIDPESNFGFKLFRQHAKRGPRLKRLLFGPRWHTVMLLRD